MLFYSYGRTSASLTLHRAWQSNAAQRKRRQSVVPLVGFELMTYRLQGVASMIIESN
ncbi:MAG: hypothetical protein ABL867_12045 [Rickettsiales bacterium]